MRTVRARFSSASQTTYSFLVPEGDNPQVGDLLITSISMLITSTTVANSRDVSRFQGRAAYAPGDEEVIIAQPKIATVVEIEAVQNPKATKFYMQLVSAEQIKARQNENRVIEAKLKIKRDVEAKLDDLLDSQDKAERYAKLAEVSPDAKRLLDILKGLETGWIEGPQAPAPEPLDLKYPQPGNKPIDPLAATEITNHD